MQLTKEEVQHVAQLARLELTENEVDTMTGQLSGILNYVDQLREVNTDNTEPTAQVTGLVDVMRADELEDWNKTEIDTALKQAPQGLEGNQIKVKKVLEQD